MSKIYDECLEPFYIEKDAHCYVVNEKVTPNPKYTDNTKSYIKPVGYYSTFGNALRKVAQEKLNLPENEYYSIEEYIQKWELLKEQINKMLKLKTDL